MANGVNIATAYLTLVPTLQGAQGQIAQQMGQEGTRSSESFLGSFKGKALAGIGGVAVAVGAAFVDAYNEAIDVRAAGAKLQANLGISPEESAKFGKLAGKLYAQNYGESISEVTATIGTVASSIKGLDDAGLERATAKAISFAQAFDTDVSTAVQNVSTLVGSGLVKSSDEAFDLLTKSSQQVPEALRGSVADASDEYAQFFRTLGFSGQDAFGALVKGAEKGEFGIDKTGDAIKEFTLLSTDMSEKTVGAYESIGLNATDMTNAILSGGDSAKDAFDRITDGILGIQDPAAQSQAALALFGTPLEDMNVQDIPEFIEGLKGMSGGMGDAAGAADQMDAAMGSTSSGVELFWRGLKVKMVDFITDKVLPAITQFTQWLGEKLAPVIEDVSEWVESSLVPAIQDLAVWMGEHLGPVIQDVGRFFADDLVPFIQQAVVWFNENLLPAVQRFGEFVGATFDNIATVVGGIIDFLGGIFTGDWSRVWEGIKAIFQGIWDQIGNIVGLAKDLIFAIGGQILDWLGQLPGWAWDRIKAFAGFIAEKGQEFLQWLWDGITAKAEEVWAWFTALPGQAWDALVGFVGAGGGWLIDRGSEFLDWMWTGIKAKFTDIKNWFFSLPATLWGFVSEKWEEFIGWGEGIVNRMVEGIKSAGPAIKQAILDLFDFNLFESDRQVDNLKDLAGGGSGWFGLFGGARGAVVPGTDPGRRDNGIMAVRSGEAIMVPEWTKAIGGAPAVHAMNRAAEQGRLAEMMWLPGFARGGVFGQSLQAVGASAAQRAALALREALKQGLSSGMLSPFGADGGSSNGMWGPANPSGLAANTAAARDFIMKRWGITNIGGWRASGSVPGSDHPLGKALDVMIANYLSPGGIAQGTSIADWFVQNPNTFGTKYVIWRDRINQGGVWRPYSHPGGNNDTLAHRDHVHISYLTGAGQFSGGAALGDDNPAKGGILARFFGALSSRGGGAAPSPVGGGAFPPNVERWRPLMADVLAKVGAYKGLNLSGYTDRGLMQINSESSGDPNAINLYDINAQRGNPSIGLLQVIRTTFEAALRGTPFAGLIAAGQRDPRASLTASTLYSLGRYTTLDRAWQGKPYRLGGIVPNWGGGIDSVPALLSPGEGVFTPSQTDAIITNAKAIEAGFAGFVPNVHVYIGDRELTELVDVRVEVGMDRVAGDINTMRAQTR